MTLSPELRRYLEAASHALDCCVQLAGSPLGDEFDAMERRLDEILAEDFDPPRDEPWRHLATVPASGRVLTGETSERVLREIEANTEE